MSAGAARASSQEDIAALLTVAASVSLVLAGVTSVISLGNKESSDEA